jgi:hypothetical protein
MKTSFYNAETFSLQDNLQKSAEKAFSSGDSFIFWYVSANKQLLEQYPAMSKEARKSLSLQAWQGAAKRQAIIPLAAFRR